ncbi:MAG: hypothetical protein ACI4IW_03635 [Oscillospiraceae bacterium]
MERFKRIVKRLLFPGAAVVAICVPVAAALLAYTFMYKAEDSAVAYVSYVFSTYALTVLCACFTKFPKEKVHDTLHSNEYVHRYLTDALFKTHVSLYCSLGVNVAFAAVKLFYGLYYRSVWFGTLAVYYMTLAVMHFLLLHHVNRNSIGADPVSEWKRYRVCGVILMLMNTALSGVVVLVVQKNEGFSYPGYFIYVVAMYAFYNVIAAVIGAVKFRKFKSPVMSAAKIIKLAAALVSMLSLETAMLMQFGNKEDSPLFRRVMTGVTGGCVCFFVLTTAIFMIVHSTKQLKMLRSNNEEKEEQQW